MILIDPRRRTLRRALLVMVVALVTGVAAAPAGATQQRPASAVKPGPLAGGGYVSTRSASSPGLVKFVQRRVGRSGIGVRVDGVFGSKTEAAVRRFQAARRLLVDGIVGRQTMTALRRPDGRPAGAAQRRRRALDAGESRLEDSVTPTFSKLSPVTLPEGCLKGVLGKTFKDCNRSVAGMYDVSSVVLTSDGKFAYAVSYASGLDTSVKSDGDVPGGSIAVFRRDPTTGRLSQLPGADGCIADRDAPENDTTSPCARARGLGGAKTIILSPDERHVYVAAINNGISAFSRDPDTGALRQLSDSGACIQNYVTPPECPKTLTALAGVRWITISPDGRHVYASAPPMDAISAFARDGQTGELTQLPGNGACIKDRYARSSPNPPNPAPPADECPVRAAGVNHPRTIAISPDGKSVYVAANNADAAYRDPANPNSGDAVSAFSRDPATGVLTPLPGAAACIEDRAAPAKTECPTAGRGLVGAFHVTVSPDNKHVYVSSHYNRVGALAVFERNRTSGALTQLPGRDGWLTGDPTCLGYNDCTIVDGIRGLDATTISADGRYAFVASFFDVGRVLVLKRNSATGSLGRVAGENGCIQGTTDSAAPCTKISYVRPTQSAMNGPRIVVLSPDDRFAYVPSSESGTLLTFDTSLESEGLAATESTPPADVAPPVTAPSPPGPTPDAVVATPAAPASPAKAKRSRPQAPPPRPRAPGDRSPPALRVQRTSALKAARTLPIVVSCPAEPCTVTLAGAVHVRSPGVRVFKLNKLTARVPKDTNLKFQLRPSRNALSVARGALRRGRTATVRIAARAVDGTGNSITRNWTVRLKP